MIGPPPNARRLSARRQVHVVSGGHSLHIVHGEVPLPAGQTQRMTEVAIPMSDGRERRRGSVFAI